MPDASDSKAEIVGEKQYREIIASESRLVLVDFYADWCGPCKMLSPTLAEIAETHADAVRVLKVDVDDNPDLASQLGIRSIPFVQFYRGGKPVDKFVGLLPKQQILDKIRSHL